MAKIGIILGTTRDVRFADIPAAWLLELARARQDFDCELVDLRDYPMPFYNQVGGQPSSDEVVHRWLAKVTELDGYVIITAEYHHAPAGVLKNALDYVLREGRRKPVAFMGYGSVGGARAVEQLRMVAEALQMAPVVSAVHLQGADFMAALKAGKPLSELPQLQAAAERMFDDLAWWTKALKAAREAEAVSG
jgi:NAD(P)H-dependent FMN reductase